MIYMGNSPFDLVGKFFESMSFRFVASTIGSLVDEIESNEASYAVPVICENSIELTLKTHPVQYSSVPVVFWWEECLKRIR